MANTQINLMQRYISAILKAPEPLRQNPEVFNEVMSLVDDAKGKLNAAMSRGEDISNVRLFEDDQAEAIAQVPKWSAICQRPAHHWAVQTSAQAHHLICPCRRQFPRSGSRQ